MDRHYEYLLLAFDEAEKAKSAGTFPIGAVLVDSDGNVIGRGHNKVFSDGDITAHAEMEVIRQASDKLLDLEAKRFVKNEYTLYSTCEPCPMCTGTILLANIRHIVWAANDEGAGTMRIMKESNQFAKWFDRVTCLAAPYKDLEVKQGLMMAQFYTDRGYENTHWHEKYVTMDERQGTNILHNDRL